MATVGEAPTRAGRYLTQPTGYRAFMPAPLPPQQTVRDQAAWEIRLAFFLRSVIAVAGKVQTARRILQLRGQRRSAIMAQHGWSSWGCSAR
ncbi:MAG: hypothetical protein ACUVSD_03070 [Thiobacillaceae bacterium]